MGAVRLAEPINSAKFIYMPPYGARRSITPRASLQCAKVRPRGVPWMGGAVVFAFFFFYLLAFGTVSSSLGNSDAASSIDLAIKNTSIFPTRVTYTR